MIFADLFFLYVFLPVFAICYYIAKTVDRRKGGLAAENGVLLLFSLVFYAWGEPKYVFLMIAGVAVDYVCALKGKTWIGVAFHILALVAFKYGNLILATIHQAGGPAPAFDIRLPIGISFYTFQSITYLIDVKRGVTRPQKSVLLLLLYISMFPQLVAGPIVRYQTIAREIGDRNTSMNDMTEGIRRFLIGLGKKALLANPLSEVVNATLNVESASMTTGMAWLGLIAFSLQIYYDFSGYSDMAIGMGRCMGFHFEENFRKPYVCKSVTDFWRRWHISLGTFFRDYVYIPLGGNKCSHARHIFNILFVWMLTGFWHGAHWNYLCWGLYYGVLLLIEKYLLHGGQKTYKRLKANAPDGTAAVLADTVWQSLSHLPALFLVILGWGIFYFEDFTRMGAFFKTLFFGNVVLQDAIAGSLLKQNLFLLAISVYIALFPVPKLRKRLKTMPETVLATAFSAVILIASTLLLIGATANPFLYTRF